METTQHSHDTGFIKDKADYIGIAGSFLCLIHCIATPFLMLTATWLKQSDAVKEGFHSLDYVFIGVNIVAVYFATKNHHSTPVIRRALWAFLTIFSIALIFEESGTFFEYLGYAASLGLITSHIFNIRYCHSHKH